MINRIKVKLIRVILGCTRINGKGMTRLMVHNYGREVRMAEVGVLEPVKDLEGYSTGQLFLHRLFGYRGVILFPWAAKVYDRDYPVKKDSKETVTKFNKNGKEVYGQVHTYYQVLMDMRDIPYINGPTESVTFLGSHNESRNLYAIPGLDYVAQTDIIPYKTREKSPIHHELFEKFLMHKAQKEPHFVPNEILKAWKKKNHPWLELSEVHMETTDNVRVTVIPFFMGGKASGPKYVYWWRYCVRLENLGSAKVKLRERHWRIFSTTGTLETVRGRGVVGYEPTLSSETPAFQYSSHVSLQAPSGHMWGTFRMEREDGHTFDCRVPPFSLDSKEDHRPPFSSPPLSGFYF